MMRSTDKRDWSSLPTELLDLISQKLVSNFVDTIYFRAVCKSWRLIPLTKPHTPSLQLPWLMLSSNTFFSLSHNSFYSLPLPESYRLSYCSGSTHGWLFMVNPNLKMCSLLNPLTKARILLPSTLLLPNQDMHMFKVALSSPPGSSQECSIMIIFGARRNLAFCKIGDKKWKLVNNNNIGRNYHLSYKDVTHFIDKFYAVDSSQRIVVCDLKDHFLVTREIKAPDPNVTSHNSYLVESFGELLLIMRFLGHYDLEEQDQHVSRTIYFQVVREHLITKKWVPIRNLHGQAIFLGYNHSVALSASDFAGCKENCIYFTDDWYTYYGSKYPEPTDVGIYHLGSGIVEPLPGYSSAGKSVKRPPIWIAPCPWK